jgi:RHH-type proline utilization regulon transcriptional repressor/proline dehydrogenase/delta 1-pyrroline-5-carboxylate dehydrogenase
MAQIVRVILAGLRAGARFNISSSDDLPDKLLELLRRAPLHLGTLGYYVVETEQAFASRVAADLPERVRLLGGRTDGLAVALDGAPEVAIYGDEVTESGRVEILPFVKEQAVSLTAHRFGAPDARMESIAI